MIAPDQGAFLFGGGEDVMGKLTAKQQAFVDYYIETGNATEAYKSAGYAVRTDGAARANASRLLTKANIRKQIEERMAEKEKERIASQDEVLEFLTKVMRGETTEQIPVTMKDYWEMANKEPNVRDRVKAAELLGKRYAMWTEKHQHEGSLGVTIIDDIDDIESEENED